MAAPMWKGAIEEYVHGNSESAPSVLAREVLDGNLKLLEVVEYLGLFFTSSDITVRARSTQLLADLLHQLPAEFLTAKEVSVLVTFFCSKLRDHHSVQPHALYGIQALTCSHLEIGDAEVICRSIFKEIHNQSLSHGDRRIFYTIIINFLDTRLTELKAFGSDLVHGYIQAMDAEKDPRNLLLAFRCAKLIIENFSLGVFVEEMFEVVSCYFPIDFSPPPNDPYEIKKEDLILGLRGCLTATPKFASFCLPLLMEKLTSDIQNAKMDAMETLTACAEVYGADALNEFQGSFFFRLKREVFSSGSDDIEQAALGSLMAIVRALSQDVVIQNSTKCQLELYLEEILQECKRHLLDPGSSLLPKTCSILQAVARASREACGLVVPVVVAILVDQFHAHAQVSSRSHVLAGLLGFFQICGEFLYNSIDDCPLSILKSSLLPLFIGMLSGNAVPLACLSIQCLAALYKVTGLLTDVERSLVVEHLTTSVQAAAGLRTAAERSLFVEHLTTSVQADADSSIRTECITALSAVAETSPDAIIQLTLPRLLAGHDQERQVLPIMDTICVRPEITLQVLPVMAAVCVRPEITLQVLPKLVSMLVQVKDSPGPMIALAVTGCLQAVVKRGASDKRIRGYLHGSMVRELTELMVQQALLDTPSVLADQAVLESVAWILRDIVTSLSASEASPLFRWCLSLFHDEKNQNASDFPEFKPLVISSPYEQISLLALFTAVVCSIPQEVQHTMDTNEHLFDHLMSISLQSGHKFARLQAAKCLSGLVNKLPAVEVEPSVKCILQKCQCPIRSDQPVPERLAALTLWSWMTKALVLRGHRLADDCTSLLFDSLNLPDLGSAAAEAFHVVLSDSEDIMTKCMHANIKIMYRQRFFVENLPRLLHGYNSTSTHSNNKKYYLTALSHLLLCLPRHVLLSELPPLLPLLVQSLMCNDVSLQMSTMNTLHDLIPEAPAAIVQYIDSLVPQLLGLSRCQALMNMRVSALQCIGQLCLLPLHNLLPHQRHVIKALESSLDDRKRLVRKSAVESREQWFLLGSSSK